MTVKVVPPATVLDSTLAPPPVVGHNNPPSPIDDDPLIDSDEVDRLQPGSRTSKKRWRRHPDPELRMPAPIKFSDGGRNYWRKSWIIDWQRRVEAHSRREQVRASSSEGF